MERVASVKIVGAKKAAHGDAGEKVSTWLISTLSLYCFVHETILTLNYLFFEKCFCLS